MRRADVGRGDEGAHRGRIRRRVDEVVRPIGDGRQKVGEIRHADLRRRQVARHAGEVGGIVPVAAERAVDPYRAAVRPAEARRRARNVTEAVEDLGRLPRRRKRIVRIELPIGQHRRQNEIDRRKVTAVRLLLDRRRRDLIRHAVLVIGEDRIGVRPVADIEAAVDRSAEPLGRRLDDAILLDEILLALRAVDRRRIGTAAGGDGRRRQAAAPSGRVKELVGAAGDRRAVRPGRADDGNDRIADAERPAAIRPVAPGYR